MSMWVTPISRYRSYGGALHQRQNVVRSVEIVGRFRRSYSFNPIMGSSTKVASEEFRYVTDWKTPFDEQLKLLETEMGKTDSHIKSIAAKDKGEFKDPREIEIKMHDLTKELDGLKSVVKDRRKLLSDAKDATEYMRSIDEYEPWNSPEEPKNSKAISVMTDRDQEKRHQKQLHRISITIKEILEKTEILIKERHLIRNLGSHTSSGAIVPSKPADVHISSTSWSTNVKDIPVPVHKLDYTPEITNGSVIRRPPEHTSTGTIDTHKPQRPPSPVKTWMGPDKITDMELYGLHRRIDDLLQWIGDRETITEAQEMGQNYQHVLALQKTFEDFVSETEYVGNRRVLLANKECDQLISSEHDDAAIIALWKDNLNEAWENLLELMNTWTQLLDANRKLQKFLFDCRETYGQIQEKMRLIPDELGRDAGTFVDLQRKHQGMMTDLKSLESRINLLQHDGEQLLASYAGDKALEIQMRQNEVLTAWRQLQLMCDYKRFSSGQTRELFRFMQLVKDLSQWMDVIKRKLYAQEKPRDIESVESLTNNLDAVKRNIDLHEDQFVQCVQLGRDLLSQQHYGTWEIEKKLLRLTTERADLLRYWASKWEHLRLMLQVHKTAKEGPAVEAVSNGQYYQRPTGNNVDDMIRAINRCKTINDEALADRELFQALERMSVPDLKEVHRRQVEEGKKWGSTANLKRPSQEKVETTFSAENVLKMETTFTDPSGVTNGSQFEGTLIRKRTWDTLDRKAANRSWEKMYCVLRGNRLHYFKDYRHKELGEPLRGSLVLENCSAEVATHYRKKPHVFCVRFDDGAEFLFQARDEDDMHRWLQNLQIATGQLHANLDASRTSSRSAARSTSPHSGSSKMNSFFSLKKKL